MGFLGVIPASKLTAVYDIDTQTLTLAAEGTIMEATYGYRFERIPWLGGLKFRLQAWTGPLTGKKASYSFSQSFQVSLFPFFGEVIIVDAGNPNGVLVKIRFIGPIDPPIVGADGTEADTVAASVEKEILSPPEDVINVPYKASFTIKRPAETPKFGSIDLQFDPSFLELVTAGIDDGNIFWKFTSLQTGNTQVIVTLHGGIAQIVKRTIYEVHIFLLPPLEPGPVIINTKGALKSDFTPYAILSFLGRVEIARRKVMEKYPSAYLYNVVASTTQRDGVTSPYLLTQMRVMFRVDNGTATINSTGYGAFGPVEFKEGIILGNANLDWPVGMDAVEADAILKASSETGPYSSLTLVKPLYPGMAEDYYVFYMVDGSEHWVNTKTKELRKE